MKFEELKLSQEIMKGLQDNGYVEATEIQEKAIPYILEGKDIIGQSKTGTGKTAAYALPIIEKITRENKFVQAIVLCPTRELAIQITDEIRKFNKYIDNVKCVAIYGGEPIERQIISLKKGAQIVVGTPGRIMDHMRRKTLKLQNVNMVVLDEADEMLNMGFEEDIETILKEIPKQRQSILFSATMSARILKIASKYLQGPVEIKVKAKDLTVEKIEQISLDIKKDAKDEVLMRLIDMHNPEKAVVFCNTKKKVDDLIEILKKKGYKAESLHGDIKQIQRDRIMKRYKNGEFQILVATDVVARGIDVENLELVINYDIPQDEEYYVHRIGRTGRNGNFGKAYTFVVGREKSKIYNIQKYAKTVLKPGKVPTLSEIKSTKNKKFIEDINQIIEKNEFYNEDIIEELLKNNSLKEIALALLTICTDKEEKRIETELQENKINITNGGIVKLFVNVGKKDKIMVKDIVGSFAANALISGADIGKIKILDKFSFVEVPAQYAEDVLSGMNGKQIKGRSVNIEFAN